MTVERRLGYLLLFILGICVGIGMVVGFSFPALVIGVWLVIACLLCIIGT